MPNKKRDEESWYHRLADATDCQRHHQRLTAIIKQLTAIAMDNGANMDWRRTQSLIMQDRAVSALNEIFRQER